ncbi:TspO/MBR-related protein [Crepidotus variabilis]|uniref:TspO/MBR-related protein n=1 Tax=Crepidotus variabilis TaxID=179855 RepID=A0A9P6JUG7_9AGAR|nr:TspO/MBR-related protein [Crepidotus variabilis]
MSLHIPNLLLAIPRNPVTALGLPLALGFLSSSPSSKVANSNWYSNLVAPPGRPAREAFPFVWSLLYLSMGYASHVAVKSLDSAVLPANRDDLHTGIALYYGQLALNCLWSPIFFGTHSPGIALVDSVLLTGTTWYMTKLLDRPTNAKATYFLLPYCAWLGYATYLNAGTWWLNRSNRK